MATSHHWVEESARLLVLGVPLLVLVGNPGSVLPWLGIVLGVYGLFIHWYTPLQLGFLTRVAVGLQYHRIHHSIEEQHTNKNFGAFLQLWDWLFRTRYVPRPDEFPSTGVRGYSDRRFLQYILPVPLLRKDQGSR